MSLGYRFPFKIGNSATVMVSAGILLLCHYGNAFSQEPPPVLDLSLRQAVEMALARNPEMRIEAFNTAMAEADVARAMGVFDATLTGSYTESGYSTRDVGLSRSHFGSVMVSQAMPTGGTVSLSNTTGKTSFESAFPGANFSDFQTSFTASLSQPLLKNAWEEMTTAGIVFAKNSLRETRERYRASSLDTISAVTFGYNRLYALREVLDTRKVSLTDAERFLEEIRSNPAAPRLEVLNAEYGVSVRRKDVVDAERNARDQEAVVKYLLGLDPKTSVRPAERPSLEEPPDTEEQAIKRALTSRPEVKQLKSEIQSSKLNERVTRNQLLPDLVLTASGGVFETENISERSWSGGLFLSMQLDNAVAKAEYRRSRIRTEQLQAQLDALTRRIEDEIRTDMRALISARIQLQVADKAFEAAELRLQDYRESFREGDATAQHVLEAEADLVLARNSRTEAQETFSNAVTELWHDTGELYDRATQKKNWNNAPPPAANGVPR